MYSDDGSSSLSLNDTLLECFAGFCLLTGLSNGGLVRLEFLFEAWCKLAILAISKVSTYKTFTYGNSNS